jgi:hypothetical protein
MELDNLKELWQHQEPGMAPENLKHMLGKKSNSPIAKMKRNLLWELGVVVIAYGLSAVFFFTAWEGEFSSVSWLYIFMGIFFSAYYIRKYKLLKDMECMACQVRSNLDKQIHTLEKYIKFYLFAGTAILPVIIIFFYWFLQTQLRSVNHEAFVLASENVTAFKSALTWITITVILTFLYYFLNKWYVSKLYGKHVDKLKYMLDQMEDHSSANNDI